MDRNQVIGFSLLAALLIAYLVYNNQSQKKLQEAKRTQQVQDSIAGNRLKQQQAAADTGKGPAAAVITDSMRAAMPPALLGTAREVVLENKNLALHFSTKGAFPTAAELKDYKTYDKTPLYLFNGDGNELSLALPYDNARSTNTLFFTPVTSTGPQGQQIVDFSADLGGGKKVDMIYTLPAEGYMVDMSIRLGGMSSPSLPLAWSLRSRHTEKDVNDERNYSQIYYRYQNGNNDYFTIRGDKHKSLDDNLEWVGFRMHYFSTALLADGGFGKSELAASTQLPEKDVVAQQRTSFNLPLKNNNEATLQWYIGPNHYKTLKAYGKGLQEMVPLGYGVLFFVKYINMWVIIPLFNFLSSFIGSYGIIIMLLTVFIRLILSFFTYKSYLSAAKMRVLKPEVDELRAKYGEDQQRFGMEQMKLFRSAGVNPLGGCLPTLFQIPILFAMYYFFPSSIELRQKSFLWANDLSTYDSICNFGFSIPFYGDHISLFTLLMTASSLFLALYNRNMTAQDPNNPMLKWMPFIFPFMLLGVFNKMAAALTFYYFFSNTLSILQQWIIQKFIIDEKKIHAQLQENRNKPATPSKWAQRLEEMQKAQAERTKQLPRKK